LNVQNQQRIVWPKNLVVAKAYVDQFERSQALSADQITTLRQAIASAESSHLDAKSAAKLKSLAATVGQASAKTAADTNRLQSLAAILKQPAL
jgi:hypothetical protein